MGRPSVYTPEQDDIILSTSDSTTINERFRELGFEPRSSNALIRRRAYLRERGLTVRDKRPEERRLPKLLERKHSLEGELERMDERRQHILAELRGIAETVGELLEGVQAQILDLDEAQSQDGNSSPPSS